MENLLSELQEITDQIESDYTQKGPDAESSSKNNPLYGTLAKMLKVAQLLLDVAMQRNAFPELEHQVKTTLFITSFLIEL